MATGELEQARAQLQESLAVSKEMSFPSTTAWHLAQLGHVAVAMADGQEARKQYRQALQIARDEQLFGVGLDALTGWATLLAQEGERAKAQELVALALRYPIKPGTWWTGMEAREKQLFAELQAMLPPNVFVNAQERGQARDLWTTVEELLVEPENKPTAPS